MSLIDPDGKYAQYIQPVVEGEGYELVRVAFVSSDSRDNVLEVMVEPKNSETELNLDNCALLSREIAAVLDVEDPISGRYRLEVGSPGIDRPLTRLKDFERFKGFEAKIVLKESLESGQKRFKGVLDGVQGEDILLETLEGTLSTALEDIQKAKLEFSEELLTALRDKKV